MAAASISRLSKAALVNVQRPLVEVGYTFYRGSAGVYARCMPRLLRVAESGVEGGAA